MIMRLIEIVLIGSLCMSCPSAVEARSERGIRSAGDENQLDRLFAERDLEIKRLNASVADLQRELAGYQLRDKAFKENIESTDRYMRFLRGEIQMYQRFYHSCRQELHANQGVYEFAHGQQRFWEVSDGIVTNRGVHWVLDLGFDALNESIKNNHDFLDTHHW